MMTMKKYSYYRNRKNCAEKNGRNSSTAAARELYTKASKRNTILSQVIALITFTAVLIGLIAVLSAAVSFGGKESSRYYELNLVSAGQLNRGDIAEN